MSKAESATPLSVTSPVVGVVVVDVGANNDFRGSAARHEDNYSPPMKDLASPAAAGATAASVATAAASSENNQQQQQQQQQQPVTASNIDADKTAAWDAIRDSYHWRNFFHILVVGLINNILYCVVQSGAQSLADSFDLRNMLGLISWSVIAGGVFINLLNAFVWIGWSMNKRMLVAGSQALFGVLIVCLAPHLGSGNGFKFFVMLVGIVFIGTASGHGAQSMIGYFSHFPARTVGAWSTGTGSSGVVAALIYLGLQQANLSQSAIFILQLPWYAIYYYCFYEGIVVVPKEEVVFVGSAAVKSSGEGQQVQATSGAVTAIFTPTPNWKRNWWADETATAASADSEDAGGAAGSLAFTDAELAEYDKEDQWSWFRRQMFEIAPSFPFEAIRRSNGIIFIVTIHLLAQCVLESATQFLPNNVFPHFPRSDLSTISSSVVDLPTMITTASAASTSGSSSSSNSVPSCVKRPKAEFDFLTQNAFVVSQFTYQVGVALGRSSLEVYRVERVEVLTAMQAVNFLGWLIVAKSEWLLDECDPAQQQRYTWVLLVWVSLVGLIGGSMFVNAFANLLANPAWNNQMTTIGLMEVAKQGERETAQQQQQQAQSAGAPTEAPSWALKRLKAREISMNIAVFYQTIGIMLGSVVVVVLSNTIISK